MAILSKEINKVEVRIKRHPDGTYFDEYVKVGDREKRDATACERYIIPEPGTMYAVEVTLKEGYQFGNCRSVEAALYLPGASQKIAARTFYRPPDYSEFLEEDLTKLIEFANVLEVAGRKISGARLGFRKICVDECLNKETNLMGVDPKDLGAFKITVAKEIYDLKGMTEMEKMEVLAIQQRILTTSGQEINPWDAKEVDAESFKKHGITSAVGFIGGHAPTPHQYRNWKFNERSGLPLEFTFLHRPIEFMEQVNIVPYPPPLHNFSWNQLDEVEGKSAFRDLQDLARRDGYFTIPLRGDLPDELQPWNALDLYERRAAYKKLQNARKAYQRGDVRAQLVETPAARIISLLDDNQTGIAAVQSHRASSQKRTIVIDDSPSRSTPNLRGNSNGRSQPTIKVESKRLRSPSVASTATLTNEPLQKRRRMVSSREQSVRVKQEPIDIDFLDDTPMNKRQKIEQEIIEVDGLADIKPNTSVKVKREIIDLDDYNDVGHSPAGDTGYHDSPSREPPRKSVKFEEAEDMDVVEIVESGKPEEPLMTEEERVAEAERIAGLEREMEELRREEFAMKERIAELLRKVEGDMDY